ncbi:MAG: GNAT family N-acetyltransferase [Oscillochloridaceae bacterium umkhey_bin13]
MGTNELSSVILRELQPSDVSEVIALNRASATHYGDWVSPPTDEAAFAAYLTRCAEPTTASWLICRRHDGAIMGAATLSQIFYGPLQSAYLGYYLGAAFVGQGFMQAGLGLVLDQAFGSLRLHRVEANIQPENERSLALVRRMGFTREGYSRRYLWIAGAWRDHERYAMLAEDWQQLRDQQRNLE